MSEFLKTCLGHVLVLVAIAVPVFGSGCDRPQHEPPLAPRSMGSGDAPDRAPPDTTAPAPAAAATADAAAAEMAPSQSNALSRADPAITARVKTALLADEEVKALAIDVDTKDGKVTLKGNVESNDQVTRAVEVARTVEGVRDVVNRLSVKGEDKAARSTQG